MTEHAREANPVLVVQSMLEDHRHRNRDIIRIDMPPGVWDLIRMEPLAIAAHVVDVKRKRLFNYPVRVWDGCSKLYIESV